jgi:hypothetical protein
LSSLVLGGGGGKLRVIEAVKIMVVECGELGDPCFVLD